MGRIENAPSRWQEVISWAKATVQRQGVARAHVEVGDRIALRRYEDESIIPCLQEMTLTDKGPPEKPLKEPVAVARARGIRGPRPGDRSTLVRISHIFGDLDKWWAKYKDEHPDLYEDHGGLYKADEDEVEVLPPAEEGSMALTLNDPKAFEDAMTRAFGRGVKLMGGGTAADVRRALESTQANGVQVWAIVGLGEPQ